MFKEGKYERIGYKLYTEYPNFQKKHTSYCDPYQIGFLLGVINHFKFKDGRRIDNVLELGVNNGVTSLYMLKEGSQRPDFKLYGIEIGTSDFYGNAVFSDATPDELAHYHFHKGCTSFDIEKVLGENNEKKLDMVFIDAGHTHPHPIIDLIHVIPFLHEKSIVLLHDVVDYMRPNAWGESFIFCAWHNEKYRTVSLDDQLKPNGHTTLGCIKIPKNKKELYSTIEQIARTPFRAAPWVSFGELRLGGLDEEHFFSLRLFMEKYYDQDFAERIYNIFCANLKQYEDNFLLYLHETNFFNHIYKRTKRQRRDITSIKNRLIKIEKSLGISKHREHWAKRVYRRLGLRRVPGIHWVKRIFRRLGVK